MSTGKRQPKDWLLFEQEVTQLVSAFGYRAETTQPSHDYGVDIIATNAKRRIVIQCKLYGKGRIGGDTIMQLVGSRQFFEADEAICITTSQFTKQAQEIGTKQKVHLLDQDKLLRLCKEGNITIPSLSVLEANNGICASLQAPQLTIGRAPDNDIVLNDMRVSRHHANLERNGLVLTLRDCGSGNGTFINGNRISQPIKMNYGDEFVIEQTTFYIRFRKAETGA